MHNQHFLPPEATGAASRLVWTKGTHLLIEGRSKLISCDESCIRLQIHEGVLNVRGDQLTIGCFSTDQLTVCGSISALELDS